MFQIKAIKDIIIINSIPLFSYENKIKFLIYLTMKIKSSELHFKINYFNKYYI
jgi:hypothetical protein